MGLQLNSIIFPNTNAPKLLIIHGLLGCARNWSTVGKALSKSFEVHLLDIRNHGESPWDDSMDWSDLSGDITAYCLTHQIEQPISLIGHSLGGKIAMHYAAHNVEIVSKLVVVDIAPKKYEPHYKKEFKALLKMPLDIVKTRGDATELLRKDIPDISLRESLLVNLKRLDGRYAWQPNIKALYESLEGIRDTPIVKNETISSESLLIYGGASDFVLENDIPRIKEYMTDLKIIKMEQSGHNPHVDNKDSLISILLGWL
tara:strand:- start:724 stop:1497 length:774 start_codon:yes stop_codon:yes gene_type:complete